MHRMKILCRTFFDCSRTGVVGSYRPGSIPFVDSAGQSIHNLDDWTRSRNQQRNYETLLQIFGLRTQPQEIQGPVFKNNTWEIIFTSEADGVFEMPNDSDKLILLKQDCAGVPMLTGLQENKDILPSLTTNGDQQNIWFELIAVNN